MFYLGRGVGLVCQAASYGNMQMNRLASVLILSLTASGSAAFADGRSESAPRLQIVAVDCIVENSERTGNCPGVAPKPRVALVLAEPAKAKRGRITQMPWMIGAFQ